MSKVLYMLEAGRCITRDGVPIATIHGVDRCAAGISGVGYTIGHPADLDDFAHEIVCLLNNRERERERVKDAWLEWESRLTPEQKRAIMLDLNKEFSFAGVALLKEEK